MPLNTAARRLTDARRTLNRFASRRHLADWWSSCEYLVLALGRLVDYLEH